MSEQTPTTSNDFAARAMALAIDFTLLGVLHSFLFFLTAGWLIKEIIYLDPLTILVLYTSLFIVFGVSFIFLHIVYFTIFHAWSGQTIGKLFMGIKVVSAGNKLISPAVAFLRWAGYLVSAIPLGAGFLWAAVDKDHCAWHDRLAKTRVITVEMT
jgi:uncharacterized RDD family membrane protein YckC